MRIAEEAIPRSTKSFSPEGARTMTAMLENDSVRHRIEAKALKASPGKNRHDPYTDAGLSASRHHSPRAFWVGFDYNKFSGKKRLALALRLQFLTSFMQNAPNRARPALGVPRMSLPPPEQQSLINPVHVDTSHIPPPPERRKTVAPPAPK